MIAVPSPSLADSRPKVSVVVAIYKVEAYIERCARSLFEQSLDDIEYLFIDDCTPDRSIEVLQGVLSEYPIRQPQVTIHKMERNSGLPAVRKWGIQHASGEFVIQCDGDDWVEPDMYGQMYEMAVRENADMVVCDFDRTDGTKVYVTCRGCTETDSDIFARNLLLQKDAWTLWNKLVRRDCCPADKLMFASGNMGEDMVLTIQMVLNAKKICSIHRTFYHYFINTASITHMSTEDRRMTCFHQNKANADIVFDFLRLQEKEKLYADCIVYAKSCIKQQLWLTRFDADKFRLWQATYPEIDRVVPFSRHITLRNKIKFILTNLRLYPFHK